MMIRPSFPRKSFSVAAIVALLSGCGINPMDLIPNQSSPYFPGAETPAGILTSAGSVEISPISQGLEDEIVDNDPLLQPELAPTNLLDSLDSLDSLAGDSQAIEVKPAANLSKRQNPFEFEIDVDFQCPQQNGEKKVKEIKLYGFVGNQNPQAIINADGQTKLMSVGEKWGVIELLEIRPPEVLIRAEGITRTWSLLGKLEAQTASNE